MNARLELGKLEGLEESLAITQLDKENTKHISNNKGSHNINHIECGSGGLGG